MDGTYPQIDKLIQEYGGDEAHVAVVIERLWREWDHDDFERRALPVLEASIEYLKTIRDAVTDVQPGNSGGINADRVLSDPAASNWLKAAILFLDKRDPVDAFNDAEVLAKLQQIRCRQLLSAQEVPHGHSD
ncbi:MAG: hypothetical protein N0E56_15835 [Candidatus Thiodiazotropha endolucinida]|nr:hypothetical protein [Candidatus Thiodiazotropha taylori]MCW4268094.1 hypothetical protein [Candidatus Thiodiazotropha endolucinida]